MKKRILFYACILATLASCQKNPSDPESGSLNCTMAIYGCCGGAKSNSVEVDYVNELIDAMWIGPTEKIKVISQHNFDYKGSDLAYLKGTAVMRLLKQNTDIDWIDRDSLNFSGCASVYDSNVVRSKAINSKLAEMVTSGAYSFEKINGDTKSKMYLPSEIAKFLDRAATDCPSDHYYLCISGHGGGWDAKDDMEISKAVAFDNNLSDSLGISAKNLTAGINASSIATKVPIIYFNACQMNFLENVCEYAACPASYAMISFKNTNGTDNRKVLKAMIATKGNTVSDLLNALISVYPVIYKNKKCDISFVDIKKMKSAAAGIKTLVPLLKEDYKSDQKWYNSEIYNLNCPGNGVSCDKDFSQFLDDLINEENIDSTIKATSSSILTNIKGSIVKTIYGDSCVVKKNLLVGAVFLGKTKYAEKRKDYASSFDNNAFYSLTGWNTLFEVFDDDIN